MIQRMGRVLRKKADGRLARFVIFYVQGTSEDPAQGAHEDFLGEIFLRHAPREVSPDNADNERVKVVDQLPRRGLIALADPHERSGYIERRFVRHRGMEGFRKYVLNALPIFI